MMVPAFLIVATQRETDEDSSRHIWRGGERERRNGVFEDLFRGNTIGRVMLYVNYSGKKKKLF